MPSHKPTRAPDTPPETDDTAPAPAAEEIPEAVPGPPEPGVYEYTHSTDCTYLHVPLSARAARPASADEPAQAATVFDWPFGPPDDGRWSRTRKKPNQAADNEPALPREE